MEKKLRILIVEDLESDAEILKMIIARNGIEFVDRTVETREDFVTALREFSPDLILSDYSLPQFNGMVALQLRQELAPGIPFLLVTGSQNEEVAVECMKAGADDYIIKQNLIRLIPAIKAALLKQETIRLRREAEMALSESEKKFRNLYSHMAEGVCLHKLVYDADGKPVNYSIVGVNQQFEQFLDLKEADVVGKLATEIYNSTDPPHFEYYLKAITEEKSLTFESYYAPLDKHFLISVSPWDNDGFASIFTDFTARKRAEEAIRKERILLRTLIDNLPDSIYAKDHEGRKILANFADIEASGCASEADVMGKTDLEIYAGEMAIRGYAEDMQVLKTGEPILQREQAYSDASGKRFWLLTSKLPLSDELGHITGLVGIGHNVTERKRVEEELRKLSGAVEQNPVSVVITDLNGIIEYVNPKFTLLTGYTREEATGKSPGMLKSGTTTTKEYKQLWDTIKSGGEWHGELRNKKKNGEFFFESVLISPISDEKGHITHFLASMEDISDRKRAEDELRQKVEELAISNDELSRFNHLAIGREMRMIEIKKHCNHLAYQLGIAKPYPLAFLEEGKNKPAGKDMSAASERGD